MRLAVGGAQGLALYLLHRTWEAKGSWAQAHPALFWGVAAATAAAPVVVLGGLTLFRRRTLAGWTILAALAMFGLAFHAVARQGPPETGLPGLPFEAVVAMAGLLYIAHHLVAGADAARRLIAAYPVYFDIAWKDAVQVALSLAFVGVFWTILFLGASLFDLIGLKGFGQVIRKDWFVWPANSLAFAAAVHVTDVRARLVRGLRTVALVLLSWLMPMSAVIAAVFVGALPVTGLKPLWSAGSAGSLLLGAAAGLVILINAAYQDGSAETRAPVLLRHAGRVAAALVLPLVGLAAYAIVLRGGQYGWSPDRVVAAACVLVGAVYGVGYLFAAVRPGDWLRPLERTNIMTAVVAIAVLVAVFSPLADPGRISAADQVARLTRGEISPDRFDYGFLRFEAGRYGIRALQALTRSKIAGVAERARINLAREDRFGVEPEAPRNLRARLTVRPAAHALPDALVTAVAAQGAVACEEGCLVTFVDLDRDGRDEALVSNDARAALWSDEPATGWAEQGDYVLDCHAKPTFRSGPIRTMRPRFDDLDVGGRRIAFTPERAPPTIAMGPEPCPAAPAK